MKVNPFTPNFGQVPLHIAGRKDIIADIGRVLDGDLGSPSRTSILIGARGCGKTALLTYLSEHAKSRGWIAVNASCMPGIQEDIIQQIVYAGRELLPKENKTYLTGVSVANLFRVDWERNSDNHQNWRSKMTELLEALEEFDAGLFVTIDEVNPKLDEMVQIASIYQLLVRENRRIVLLMAGLPSEVSSLLNDRSVSFLRRANQYDLGQVEDYEVADAFRRTVTDSGKKIDEDALKMAVEAIDGFPYMLQLVGFRAWDESGQKTTIVDRENVRRGIELANRDFESRVLRATVSELSDIDLAFLEAMIPDEAVSQISDIEKRMNKSSGYVSRYRARLIAEGVIESAGRGKVRFALPGLRAFLMKD